MAKLKCQLKPLILCLVKVTFFGLPAPIHAGFCIVGVVAVSREETDIKIQISYISIHMPIEISKGGFGSKKENQQTRDFTTDVVKEGHCTFLKTGMSELFFQG